MTRYLSQSDELLFPGGSGARTAYPFQRNGEKVAELRLEYIQADRGYFDIDDRRYQLLACRGEKLLARGSIQVNVDGLNIIEFKVNWLGNRGEIISRWGHRYTCKVIKRPARQFIVEHNSSEQVMLSFSPRDRSNQRRIKVGGISIDKMLLEQDEIIGLIAAIAFYLIRVDFSEEIAAISVPTGG